MRDFRVVDKGDGPISIFPRTKELMKDQKTDRFNQSRRTVPD